MAEASISFDAHDFDEVIKTAQKFGDGALALVDDIIHKEAGDLIRAEVSKLIPESGRTWKGKKAAAAKSDPYGTDKTETMLAVTVHTRSGYHYLYFPDDGSNTKRHAGNQQFFKRGAENAAPDIIDLCVSRLIDEFNGG